MIDPVPYSPMWLVGLGVLAGVFVLWLCLIPFLTKRKLARKNPEILAASDVPKTLRETYRERIQALAQQLQSGEIDTRHMHLELSALVREYVTRTTGVSTKSMTYSDLLDNPRTEPIADVIAQCYHPAFSPEGSLQGWDRAEQPQPITVANALNVIDAL